MTRLLVGAGLVALFVVFLCAFTINQGEQGLVLQFGEWKRTIQEPGLHFKLPDPIQNTVRFEKRVLTADAAVAEYITLDKKRVLVDHVSRWRIERPLEFYQSVQNPTGARLRLGAIISARMRQEVASHNFLDLISEKREDIMSVVAKDTREEARPLGIEVIDVRIKRLDLPQEVQASVFARMQAERQRIAKRYRAEGDERARKIRAEADREREVILAEAYEKTQKLRGEGDAQAAEIYANAFGKDTEFYAFVRRLEAYEKILSTDTTLVLRPDSELLHYLEGPGNGTNETSREEVQ